MKNIITHSLLLILIIFNFIFNYFYISLGLLLIEIVFLSIIECSSTDCTVLRFFYLKKIYTDWGVFYTGAFGRYIYIYKDIFIFFLNVYQIDIKYDNITDSEQLKQKIIRAIKSSPYLEKRIDSFEEKKKRNEIKKVLNNWSGFTSKQLERDHKISKLL